MVASQAHAAYTCTATTTGNWSNPTTWGGTCGSSRYPGEDQTGDTVTINSGVTVTLDVSPTYSIGSLSTNAASVANGVTWGGTNSLSVSGATTVNAPTAAVNSTLAVGGGTFTANGLITINGGGTSNYRGVINAATGTININGGLSFGGAAPQAQFTTSGAATINLASGTLGLGAASGTISFNAATTLSSTGSSTIGWGGTFGILTVPSGTLTVNSSTTIAFGTTTVSGSLVGLNVGSKTFGSIVINSSGSFDMSGTSGNVNIGGNVTNNSSNIFKGGGGSNIFTASSTIGGSGPFSSVGTATINAGVVLTINDTAPITFSSSVIGSNASSTIIAGSGTDIIFLGNSTNILSTGTLVPYNGSSTIEYNYAGSQTLKSPTTYNYYNLIIGGSGTKTIPAGISAIVNNLIMPGTAANSAFTSNLSIGGMLSVASGTVFATTNGYSVTVTGDVAIFGAGRITNNTANGFTIGGNLIGTGQFTQGLSSLLTLNGSSTSISTLTATAASNTVSYASASGGTILGTAYFNLIATSSGQTFLLGGNVTTTGALTISTSTTLDVSPNNYALTIGGNYLDSGTFNAETGTVFINGLASSATTTIYGSNTFYNLVINKANKPVIAFISGSTQTVQGSFAAMGDSSHQITLVATSSGTLSPFTLSQSSGSVLTFYTTIIYSTATGGALWYAPTTLGNKDGGNNSGWIFSTSSPPNVYYSVGQVKYNDSGGNLLTGSPTVSILNSIATFSVAQTGNIGVGDRVTYNGSSTAWISGRISQTAWNIVTAFGLPVSNITNSAVSNVGHEYNSLNSALTGASDASHLTTANLTILNVVLDFPCYYDNGPDTTSVTVPAYTTSAADFIRIYTATSSTEVNHSQRHTGVWTNTAYQLSIAGGQGINNHNHVDFLRVDGIQISITATSSSNYSGILVMGVTPSDVTDYQLSNNIIAGYMSGNSSGAYGIQYEQSSLSSTDMAHIWNNIIYGFVNGTTTNEFGILTYDGNAVIYNNTLYNNYYGLRDGDSYSSVIVKNNIVQDSTVGYSSLGYSGHI